MAVSMGEYRRFLADDVFKQMMFVSGETGDPSPDTTAIIEEIVRQQVVEIVGSNSYLMHFLTNFT